MIERLDDFPVDERIEAGEIGNHAGGGIYGAGNADFDGVVMTVAVGIVALAEDAAVLFLAEERCMQPVGGRETVAASEHDFCCFCHGYLCAPNPLDAELRFR